MQIIEAKSQLSEFMIEGEPRGLFYLKTQYGYDLKSLDGSQYLFSCISASEFIFHNDAVLKFACDVAFMLSSEELPTLDELLALAEGARDEMNRVLDKKLDENELGIMEIAKLNIAETEAMLEQARLS